MDCIQSLYRFFSKVTYDHFEESWSEASKTIDGSEAVKLVSQEFCYLLVHTSNPPLRRGPISEQLDAVIYYLLLEYVVTGKINGHCLAVLFAVSRRCNKVERREITRRLQLASLAYNVHEGIIPPVSSDMDNPANRAVKAVYERLHYTRLKGVLTRPQSSGSQRPNIKAALEPVKKAAVEMVCKLKQEAAEKQEANDPESADNEVVEVAGAEAVSSRTE